MPSKTVHCSICGYAVTASSFKERMAKLRSHRKVKHPKAHKKSVKKGRKLFQSWTQAEKYYIKQYGTEKGLAMMDEDHSDIMREIERHKRKGKLDPELKVRKKLIASPQVETYTDINATGLVRVLFRVKGDRFPEFALYPKRNRFSMELKASLHNAGLTDEGRGKWVLRTNKFNIFVYV